MDKRRFLGELSLLAVGAALGVFGRDYFFDRHADRRFALYGILRELRKGTSRGEVEAIVSRHDAPFIQKHSDEKTVELSVRTGMINMLYLVIKFSGDKLETARLAGEDNPQDVPQDAPPNVE